MCIRDRNSLFALILIAGCLSQVSAQVVYSSNLEATEHELGNLLQWTTSLETNSKSFIIEKSLDGVNYSKIATVDALGNSNENKSYVYLDMDLSSKNQKLNYRFRQVDLDGTSSYSKVAMLNKMIANDFSINGFKTTEIPNEYILTYESNVAGDLQMDVVEVTGLSVVETESFTASVGVNELNLDMKNIDEGTYELVFTIGNEKETVVINKTGEINPNMLSRKTNKKDFKN